MGVLNSVSLSYFSKDSLVEDSAAPSLIFTKSTPNLKVQKETY